MLLRTGDLIRLPLAAALLVALVGTGCPGESVSEEPPLQAPRVYRVIPGLCGEDCRSLTLYRDGTYIELRAHHPGDDFAGRAEGSLTDDANDQLSDLIEGLTDLGALPGNTPIDGPLIELTLPWLRIEYTQGFPPSGLAEIDGLLADVLDDLSQCRITDLVVSNSDCEQLAYFPE